MGLNIERFKQALMCARCVDIDSESRHNIVSVNCIVVKIVAMVQPDFHALSLRQTACMGQSQECKRETQKPGQKP